MPTTVPTIDPKLDLVLEREVDVPPELVWAAWTQPEHLKQWFAPRPWKTIDAELDVRPGGIFRTVMQSPEGHESPGTGCILEAVPNRRLVWTDALLPGYRPSPESFFTVVIELEPRGSGTLYRATAIHKDEAGRKRHEEMGFFEGWGTMLTQLVEYVKANLQR
jgi:uncharacterized protein YndB with AHSA1/START domain